MNQRKNFRVIQTYTLQVWNEEKKAYEEVVGTAPFFKEDDKQLFIGWSVKKSRIYAKTENGLVAGPSMFTKAEYLGGAFIYSKGREWYLQIQGTVKELALGCDATYECLSGIYVIETYDVELRDSVIFLYFPETQKCLKYVDTYYRSYRGGVLLHKGREYVFVKAPQVEISLGHFNERGDFFWRLCQDGHYLVSSFELSGKHIRKLYADLSMAECVAYSFDEQARCRYSSIAWINDERFDVLGPVWTSSMIIIENKIMKSINEHAHLHTVILGFRDGDSYIKAFEGEVYLQWKNLIVLKQDELFVLYHVGRNGNLTEISSSPTCTAKRLIFFDLSFRLNYFDYAGIQPDFSTLREKQWRWDAQEDEDEKPRQPEQSVRKKWWQWF